MAASQLYVYGYLGSEQEIDHHIKTRIIFAAVDGQKTRLAWYLFSQDMVAKHWDAAFDQASIGSRKLDRNEIFGEATSWMPHPSEFDPAVDATKLAPQILKMPGSWATLHMNDSEAGTTYCTIYSDFVKPNGVILEFDLMIIAKRRTLDIRKTGALYRLGVEKFTPTSLERGPTRGVSAADPYDPMF